MPQAVYKIKDSTRKRCKVAAIDAKSRLRFSPVSLELFHFLNQAKSIDFSLYFLTEDTAIEYIRAEELSKELLQEMWEAMQKQHQQDLCISVLKADRPRFEALIGRIRSEKLSSVRRKLPDLDGKTLDLYSHLSTASQMIVTGGIDANVMAQVRGSAAFMVSNVLGSDVAISTLSRMILCDPTLYDHSATVAMIATVIGQSLLAHPLQTKEAQILAEGALYHDVGKTCVPTHILNKPGKLTPAEHEVMKEHTLFGSKELERMIAAGAGIDQIVVRIALEHHEKWDGTGYPHARRGAAEVDPVHGIHLYARIVTIADIYSALLMKRVYKPAFEPQDAIKVMVTESHGFDPAIFMPFLKGVVKSLNSEQAKSKHNSRILVMDDKGGLDEWTAGKKAAG